MMDAGEELMKELDALSCDALRLKSDVHNFRVRSALAKVKVEQFSGLSPYMTPETMAALEEFSGNPHAFDVTVAAHYVGNALRAIKWMHERHVNDVDQHNSLLRQIP
jgi:hypothetical protein